MRFAPSSSRCQDCAVRPSDSSEETICKKRTGIWTEKFKAKPWRDSVRYRPSIPKQRQREGENQNPSSNQSSQAPKPRPVSRRALFPLCFNALLPADQKAIFVLAAAAVLSIYANLPAAVANQSQKRPRQRQFSNSKSADAGWLWRLDGLSEFASKPLLLLLINQHRPLVVARPSCCSPPPPYKSLARPTLIAVSRFHFISVVDTTATSTSYRPLIPVQRHRPAAPHTTEPKSNAKHHVCSRKLHPSQEEKDCRARLSFSR